MIKGLALSDVEGFTLIELIVVVAIMAIMTGVGLAYFNNFNEEKKINSEVSRLVDVLHLAHSKSTTNDLSPMPACTDFSGYKVEIFEGSPTSYDFVFCCGNCLLTNRVLLQSHTMYSTVNVLSRDIEFLFRPLIGQTVANTVLIKNTILNRCAEVDVQTSGLISNTNLDDCP